MGAFFWGYSGYSYSSSGIKEYMEFQFQKERSYMFQISKWNQRWPENYYICTCDRRGRPRRISRQKFPKRTCILSILSKSAFLSTLFPFSHGCCLFNNRSRYVYINGMMFHSFQKRNSSQKNTNTVYSEYSYSRIVPKECTLWNKTGISRGAWGVKPKKPSVGGVWIFSGTTQWYWTANLC